MRRVSCTIIVLFLVCAMAMQCNTFLPHSHSVSSLVTLTQDPQNSNLTWSARTQQIPIHLENNSVAAGDHVIVNGTFSPSLYVTECELNIWNGFTFTSTRPVIPASDPDGSFEGSIIYDDFDWVVIKGMEQGLTVNITCNFTNSNSDFVAYLGTMDPSLYSYSKSLVDMASDDQPEQDSFIWEFQNDTMILGCFNTANSSSGTWTVVVQIGVNATISNTGSTIAFDTYYLEDRNQTCNIVVTGTNITDSTFILRRDNVSLCNFFAPVVVVNSLVVVNDEFTNISWSCSDMNQDDVNYFEIWVSGNDGISFFFLYGNFTATTFIWDTTGWGTFDYIVRIRAFSVDVTSEKNSFDEPPQSYWPGDYSDGISPIFDHNGIFPISLSVSPVDNVSYEFGTDGNFVNMTLHFYPVHPESVDFIVRDNGTIWFENRIQISSNEETFELDIDGLSLGSHDIQVDFLLGGHVLVNFTVHVGEPSSAQYVPLVETIGLIGGIAIIILFVIYMKKLREIKRKNDNASNE